MAVGRSALSSDGGFWSYAFVVGGIAAATVYAADFSKTANVAAFVAVALGSAVALFTGPRRFGAEPRGTWLFFGIACLTCLVGAIVRPWAATETGPAALLSDAFTVPGYLLMIAGLVKLLRTRGSIERHALVDGLIVCLGAGLASAVLLAIPAASIQGRAMAVSTLAAVYPLFDVVLVLLMVGLAFTTVVRRPSYAFLVIAMAMLLTGDLAYAVIGASGRLTGSWLLDLPFLFCYTMIGAAALHPSVVELGRAAPVPVQTWSWPRLLVLGPALAAPFALTTVSVDRSLLIRVLLGGGGAAMVALLLVRAAAAVHDYAAGQLRFKHQATHDPLTGLPNRTMLLGEVDQLLVEPPADGRQLWVCFLDLDGFKLVNDSWGHEAGDQLIIEVAQRLLGVVPQTAIVARVGGDEFLVVYTGTRHEAVDLVERLMKCIGTPLQVGGAEVVISASVGIAGTPSDLAAAPSDPATAGGGTVTAKSLMRDADTAMYQAKAEGRGKWAIFDASMHERVRERVEIELALHQAMAHGQLYLAYQPIVELTTGALLGAEALIRWDHPTRGLIPPNSFIPIAEDVGLISAIGRWVLREALGQLAAWRADRTVSEEFWISVNVSPRQLRDPGLPATVDAMLLEYGVPASAVVLEITESVMVDVSGATEQVLVDLRALGLKIAVDDFGTGFSALGYLRRHPITGVKIDRGFVAGLGTNAEDEEIVRAVAAMSVALGLTVVAEGVESPVQREVLAGLGVAIGQGRLWGSAVRSVEFAGRCRELP
jgi:diguanylate cyclase (GGDEF)-like protein